ncbi:MAG: glycine cleavage system protein GcvH [Pseudomonadota bacterium]
METPDTLHYAKTHEWARIDDDGLVTVGITDHAQDLLGDMVFVEAPEVGRHFAAGAECAVVESVKAAADVYAPVAGTVAAVNESLQSAPEQINRQPYAAWLFKLRPDNADDVKKLMNASQYQSLVENEPT